MNSATDQSTVFSPGYLTFSRDLRTPDEATHDLKAVIDKEKPAAWVTSYLRKLRSALLQARDKMETNHPFMIYGIHNFKRFFANLKIFILMTLDKYFNLESLTYMPSSEVYDCKNTLWNILTRL